MSLKVTVNGFILGPDWRIFRPAVLEFDAPLMDLGMANFDHECVINRVWSD
jgi:hypothetical protein